jgi:hypothetical protein
MIEKEGEDDDEVDEDEEENLDAFVEVAFKDIDRDIDNDQIDEDKLVFTSEEQIELRMQRLENLI